METTQAPVAPTPAPTPAAKSPEFKIPKPKKKRRWITVLIVLAVIAALVGWFVVRPMLAATQMANSLMYTPPLWAIRISPWQFPAPPPSSPWIPTRSQPW